MRERSRSCLVVYVFIDSLAFMLNLPELGHCRIELHVHVVLIEHHIGLLLVDWLGNYLAYGNKLIAYFIPDNISGDSRHVVVCLNSGVTMANNLLATLVVKFMCWRRHSNL